jgi:hypothetical protein
MVVFLYLTFKAVGDVDNFFPVPKSIDSVLPFFKLSISSFSVNQEAKADISSDNALSMVFKSFPAAYKTVSSAYLIIFD